MIIGAIVTFVMHIITAGYQEHLNASVWPRDLVTAINQNLENPSSSVQLDRCVVNMSGAVLPGSADQFIIYDWSAYSGLTKLSSQKPEVVNPLARAITQKVDAIYRLKPQRVSLHFWGHSRGCSVHAAVLEVLAGNLDFLSKIAFVQMTTIDPVDYVADKIYNSNPGGIVDWADNYFQSVSPPIGRKIEGALNVDLTVRLRAWKGRSLVSAGNHMETHDYLLWIQDQKDDGDPNNSPYQDPDITAQRTQFITERQKGKQITRDKLYGQLPVIENFNGDNALAFGFAQGRSRGEGDPFAHNPTLLDWSKCNMNRIVGRALQLTPDESWVGASCFARTPVRGDFTAEFTIQMKKGVGALSGDGIAMAVIDARGGAKLGKIGGFMGYGGLGGFAVVFDAYRNIEYEDPADTTSRVWIRPNGQPQGKFVNLILPEPITSGNPFRVRVSFQDRKKLVTVMVYSFGADKVVSAGANITAFAVVPDNKLIGFTSSTGTFSQSHIVDDIIIVPGT